MTRDELENMPGINSLFNFGKYKGKTLLHVINNDPQYIIWCINNVKDFNIDSKLKIDLIEQYNNFISRKDIMKTNYYMNKYNMHTSEVMELMEENLIIKIYE